MALIAYIPVWIAAITLALLVSVTGIYIFWALSQIAKVVANTIVAPFVGHTRWYVRAQRKLAMRTNKLYFHSVGVVVVLVFMASIFEGFGFLTQQSLIGVCWFAYFADFQLPGNYPGVPCDGRIRLMDNGVVAVAMIVAYDIAIRQEEFKSGPAAPKGCIPNGFARKLEK